MFASKDAFVSRTSTSGRAAVNSEPAAGNTAATAAFFLAAFAAGNAAVAAFGIVNATYLAVAGGAAVAVVDGAALAAGWAVLAASRADVTGGGTATWLVLMQLMLAELLLLLLGLQLLPVWQCCGSGPIWTESGSDL